MGIFEGARREWKFVLEFIVVSLAFWTLQLLYQLWFASPEGLELALVRGFGFSGATYITLALLSSVVFKSKPAWAKYWYVRRSLGVMGFVFILLHLLTATQLVFQGDLSVIFFSLNPLVNPVIFGYLALPIFFLMAMTSTDWAVSKMGYGKWKALHRLVYFAYWASVFHFLTINPPALMNIAGYILLALVAVTVLGQFYWFLRVRKTINWTGLGAWVGYLLILMWALLTYYVLF